MITIKSVRIAPSNIEGNGPGFAVMVDPHPTDDFGKWKVAQAIRYALVNLRIDDEDLV